MLTMATRSAGCIFSFTYFFAASTARSMSSSCIELRSKKRTIRRWSFSLAGVSSEGAFDQIGDRGLSGDSFFRERGRFVHVLVVEAGDLLRLAVLEDLEVAGLQPFHERAGFAVTHNYVRENDVRIHAQGIAARGLLRGRT